jgi:hypothetical protein
MYTASLFEYIHSCGYFLSVLGCAFLFTVLLVFDGAFALQTLIFRSINRRANKEDEPKQIKSR